VAKAGIGVRADAKRNYDRLLEAARDAFVEQGTDASLRDVARRAGVGIGTLYRHFPTRESLLEALLSDRFEQLSTLAEELRATHPPAEALTVWLQRFAESSSMIRGLPESVMAALQDETSQLHTTCAAMRAAGGALLIDAQHAHTVRDDVTANELFALAGGIAWAAQRLPDSVELGKRLLAVIARGIGLDSTNLA